MESTKEVLVVANRLPLTIKITQNSDVPYNIVPSSGGLVSALKSIKKIKCKWLGWPGTVIPKELQDKIRTECEERNSIPVFLPEEIADDFYTGYSNGIIWPILHYVLDSPLYDVNYLYNCYVQANRLFALEIAKYYNDRVDTISVDTPVIIWIHDYHLMLLPEMIRALLPDLNKKISFFLHTPFPHSKIWNMLVHKKELLIGLLHCDMIGFHIYEYQKHFMNACESLLDVKLADITIDATKISGIEVHTSSNPIGIDPEPFIQMSLTDEIRIARINLRARYNNRMIILGVDRLDYMKGVYQKLMGIQKFLEKYPEMQTDVVFIQLAVPSRQNVPEYKRLKSTVHELVGRINGTSTSLPYIEHWDQSLNFKQLVAVYTASDVCLITSVRDGMNLVAYEYVACQSEHHGILLLSEFAGAERSLAHGVFTFNPWSPDAIADTINDALIASKYERTMKHKWSFSKVIEYTAEHWANTLLKELTA